jgi:hypothetical protein
LAEEMPPLVRADRHEIHRRTSIVPSPRPTRDEVRHVALKP